MAANGDKDQFEKLLSDLWSSIKNRLVTYWFSKYLEASSCTSPTAFKTDQFLQILNFKVSGLNPEGFYTFVKITDFSPKIAVT